MSLTFLDRLQRGDLMVSDGATGTNHQANGLALGQPPEEWVYAEPEKVQALHRAFVDAGSDIILTCTFGGTRVRMRDSKYANRVPELNKRGIAALGMTPLGGTASAVKSGLVKAEEMLRYAMSLPVATTITGMDSFDVLHQNLRVARGFKPMTAQEMQALRDRCAETAGDGRYEFYKLSLRFDNPQARLPHGFPLDIKQKEVEEMLYKEAGGP